MCTCMGSRCDGVHLHVFWDLVVCTCFFWEVLINAYTPHILSACDLIFCVLRDLFCIRDLICSHLSYFLVSKR